MDGIEGWIMFAYGMLLSGFCMFAGGFLQSLHSQRGNVTHDETLEGIRKTVDSVVSKRKFTGDGVDFTAWSTLSWENAKPVYIIVTTEKPKSMSEDY